MAGKVYARDVGCLLPVVEGGIEPPEHVHKWGLVFFGEMGLALVALARGSPSSSCNFAPHEKMIAEAHPTAMNNLFSNGIDRFSVVRILWVADQISPKGDSCAPGRLATEMPMWPSRCLPWELVLVIPRSASRRMLLFDMAG